MRFGLPSRAGLRLRWDLWQLDRALHRQQRTTLSELRKRVGPYARRGDGLAPTMHRIPPDERDHALSLLRRVDLGPGKPGVDVVERLYDLLDELGERRSKP